MTHSPFVFRRPVFHSTRLRPTGRGFTTIELLVSMAIVAVLAGIALPTFKSQVAKARRSDAWVALTAAQWAQARWRGEQASYGSLAEIGVASTSSGGHYSLQLRSATAMGYEVVAAARGAQLSDTACRTLRLRVEGADVTRSSGPDDATENPAAANRQCWSL